MPAPAPLDVIREKLGSKTEDVRIVALLHAQAHGPKARPLARDVARAFEDESEAVAWHAMGTFLSIGRGAKEAVPVLVEQIAKGQPDMLVNRALSALACVGPPAKGALPLLLELVTRAHGRRRESGLDALLAIAPASEEVQDILVEAAFSKNGLSLANPNPIPKVAIPRVKAEIEARLERAKTPAEREAAIRPLSYVAAADPKGAIAIAVKLLEKGEKETAWLAVNALSKVTASLSDKNIAALVRAAENAFVRKALVGVFESLGPRAKRAREILLRMLDESKRDLPLAGPDGKRSHEFAAAAKALASCSPADRDAFTRLAAWIDRVAAQKSWPKKPSLYTLSGVVLAAAQLGVDDAEAGRLVVEVARMSRRAKDDRSGQLDLVRRLRRAIELFSKKVQAKTWTELDAIGVPRVDPYAEDDGEEKEDEEAGARERAPSVPPFPKEKKPEPPPALKKPSSEDALAIAAAIEEGARLLEMKRATKPKEVAKAIDEFVQDVQEGKRKANAADSVHLGALFGDALVRGAGFHWARITSGDGSMLAVLSKEETHACAALSYLASQLERGTETTVLLLYNMAVAKRLPPKRDGQITFIA